MSTDAELLERFKPFLKYDSHEPYFADSAAEWTDNPGNELRRADGTVLARAGNGLELSFLRPKYSANAAAAKTDVIANPSGDYVNQARKLHADPKYANRVYAHAIDEPGGERWLQYWFFYFYNDYNLIGSFLHAGLHEGDWEMIQVRLRGDGAPDLAVYCQHAGASSRDWRQVDRLPSTDRPIVYVARGSHASYFEPGTQWTGHWFDHADGKRKSPELGLEVVDERDPAWDWIRWPGHWGDTKKTANPLDSDSPPGPGAHKQWAEPSSLVPEAEAEPEALVAAHPPTPASPVVQVGWTDDGEIRVGYQAIESAVGLVVTVNSPDDPGPPLTRTFQIDAPRGDVLVPGVDPAHSYDVYTSIATADGLASESVRADLRAISRPAA